jgi:hypothetical protein
MCFPEADSDLRGSSSNQRSNTSIHAQKGGAYKVRHDSLHAQEQARGCMEQLMETTIIQLYSRSCPCSTLYSVRALFYETG